MKKVISLILVFVFLVSLAATSVIAQDAPPSDDPTTLQTIEEVQQALGDCRQKLSEAGLLKKFKLIQQIKKLEARLIDLITEGEGAKPTQCVSLFDQLTGRTDKAIEQITNMICPDTAQRVDITFHPMFEHCKSPFDTKCVCGHHPERPECMSGMSGSSMTESCISAQDAQLAIQDLQRAQENLAKLQQLDADTNSVPDLCEKQN